MRQKCVLCVFKRAPPSQFVVSAKSIIVLKVLMPTTLFAGHMRSDKARMLNSAILPYAACFVGKVCGPLWSSLGASLGEGKSGVKVGMANTVGRQANTRLPPPPPPT